MANAGVTGIVLPRMPELPEVEALMRRLRPRLEGRRLVSTRILNPRPCRPSAPADLEPLLRDRLLLRLHRRAKYLVFQWEPKSGLPTTLLVHLGMTGSLVFSETKPLPGRHDVASLEWDHGHLIFEDPRRFGVFTCDDSALARLGPEPLSTDFTPRTLARLGSSRQPIKVRLMDPALVSGIGNIYASELLHRAGISPRRRSDRIRDAEWAVLHGAIRQVLEEAIARNVGAYDAGISPYYHEAGTRGTWSDDASPFLVYDREGEPCARCATAIRRCEQAGRSTYWCPGCQR